MMTVSFTIHLTELSCRESSNELRANSDVHVVNTAIEAINFSLAQETV